MHTGAYICKQMQCHADAYRCVQTCTPRNLPRRLSSDSFAPVVSSTSRVRLSQNYCPPAAVCNYACRCMPTHTGVSFIVASRWDRGDRRLVLLLSLHHSHHQYCCRHTNAYKCIHMRTHIHPSPLCCCFFLPLARCAGARAGGLGGL